MNAESKLKRIAVSMILFGGLVYLGLHAYAQLRHVDVYVSRVAPMPGALKSGLHMEEHGINPTVRIESPYSEVPEKVLSPQEIRKVRGAIVRSSAMPVLVDSLTIVNATNVIARRATKNYMREYQIVKEGNRWAVESAARTHIERYVPE